jgi:hypothetical protein
VPVLDPHAAAALLPRLNHLAYSLCGSWHLAEDLTQETYLRVLARPRRLRTGREFPYLARTLRNVCTTTGDPSGGCPRSAATTRSTTSPTTAPTATRSWRSRPLRSTTP